MYIPLGRGDSVRRQEVRRGWVQVLAFDESINITHSTGRRQIGGDFGGFGHVPPIVLPNRVRSALRPPPFCSLIPGWSPVVMITGR